MRELFDKYPSFEFATDSNDQVYRIKYIESIEEKGVIHFIKKEKKVKKEKLNSIIFQLISRIEADD